LTISLSERNLRDCRCFGAAEGPVGGVRVSVEVRTVNHRFFNPSLKLPSAFTRWESDVREALRRRINRGHVSLVARFSRDDDGTAVVDEKRFAAYVEQLRSLKDRYQLGGDIDLATILRMPDVLGSQQDFDEVEGTASELVHIVDEAVSALLAMREEEGARLVQVLLDRISMIEQSLERIAQRAPERLLEQRDRLKAAVKELAEGVSLDEQRLAQEMAVIADRLDVNEELDRFGSHLVAFRQTLGSPPADGAGKRLGFLLQEMLRETNTTGSKANDSRMLHEVVLVKEELERIREQVENLE
jgi:uncharacterized protein (TIGR00255 family)